jgi:hypothetical protein
MSNSGAQEYFVDEAGDLTLFDRHKRPAVGREGVSHTFAVAAALIADPIGLASRLDSLRTQLLSDPLLAGVPSMEPAAGKTARFFHAKDDLPEVRREVFRLLDYLLWSLQRLLERQETRFFDAVRVRFALIVDVDDTRRNGYGEYYTARKPLTRETLLPVTEARSE